MYQVIGTGKSRALRVLWMLEELGQPYEHVPVNPHSEGVTPFNPAGKVPVLIVDGTPITDSTAILTYLADRHDGLTHAAGTLERARQDSLTQLILDEFDAALWLAARHSFILPEEMRLAAIKNTLRWEFERSQKTLFHRMAEDGFLTPHKGTDLAKYKTKAQRKQGEILLSSTTFRFDGSDLMPGKIGAGAFWTGMVDFVGGKSAADVAGGVQKAWDAIK